MPGLVAPAPARKQQQRGESRGMADRRRVARDGLRSNTKTTTAAFSPAEVSVQDPQLVLKKRLRAEMEALHGLLKKAELLSGKKKTVAKSGAPRRSGKDGPFMAAKEDKSEATEAERSTTCAKKRKKTMPVDAVVTEEEDGGASPVVAAETKSDDTTDDDSESCGSGSSCRGQPKAPPVAPDQGAFRGLIAKACQRKRRMCNPERQRAYEDLEKMEVDAAQFSGWIDPMELTLLGITPMEEYAVTSEWRAPCRGGCPVQRLLGLVLKKAE